MKPISDYHVHTRFSDGADELAAYVERALELRLPELGFADHLALRGSPEDGYHSIGQARLKEYAEAVRDVAADYPEVRVLLGVEVDYLPEAAEETLGLLGAYPFDYVLCSVHFVDGFGFHAACFREAAGWDDVNHVYRRYYETLGEAAATGAFDVFAHLDLPKKWGYRPSEDLTAIEDHVLRAIAAGGMAIEINTSGLDRHPVREMYPAPGLLERARAAGIALTFGSDAHRVAQVGSCFAQAAELAKTVGYGSYLRLSDRQSVELS